MTEQQPQQKPFLPEDQTSDSLYLDQLQFEPAKANKFLNFLLTNQRVIFLCIMAIMLWGIFSFQQLPLESTPEVKIPFGIVTVALPGASPSDIEELVVKKIEKKVVNLSGVKQVSSTASNSFGTVSVEFRAEEDLKDAIRRLRDAVDNAKANLPAEASEPLVSEVSFSNTPVWTIIVTGPYDNFTLRHYADQVKDELEKLPGTSQVNISGGDIAEIRVSYNPDKLNLYGLSMDQTNAIIRSNNITLPLGDLNISNFEYTLRVDGKFHTAQEIRNLPVATFSDSIIRLKDVADVSERAQERQSTTKFSINGGEPQNAISINVIKKTGAGLIDLIDAGKVRLDEMKGSTLPKDLQIETTYDVSQQTHDDFNNLSREALNTIILVTIILFLFVGLKEAFTAGIVIPLVFAATFGLMLMAGQTLNFLSLFSLILSLGLLVDDAIVVVQATKQYMATGKFTPEEAVLLVFKDFFNILLTTSLTTIFAFLPLLLASGIIGQFIRSIPLTASITLAASTIIAIAINHPMAAILERFRPTRGFFKFWVILLLLTFLGALYLLFTTGGLFAIVLSSVLLFVIITLLLWYRASLKKTLIRNEALLLEEIAFPEKIKAKLQHHYSEHSEKTWFQKATSGVVKLDKITPHYERLLKWFLDKKFRSFLLIFIIILFFLGSLALPASGILKSEFLPASDQDLMYVNIEGAPGLILADTKKVADQVEQILLQESQIKNFSILLGQTGTSASRGGGMSGGSNSSGQTNRAQFAINLWPENERPIKEKSYVYAQGLRKKLSTVQGAQVTLEELSGGPPTGADFQVQFSGTNLIELQKTANRYKDYLSAIPGVLNPTTSITLSPGEFTFKLKPEPMQLRGVTPAQVASTLRTALSGSEITSIIQGEDEMEIVAEYNPNSIRTLDQIKSLTLQNGRGQSFQLAEVADVSVGSSLTSISRLDQKRVIVLSSSVGKPALPNEVLAAFQQVLQDHPLPVGYEATFGGQNDTNTESIFSILRAMIIAFILIIATLVIQFNSFRKAILVLLTIPLAMSGVFYGLTLVGFTLSFPTLIGLVALFGIVVKNAIMLVDKINLNLKVGIPFREAITDASKSRLEAIFLTSTATIIGMIPITLYDETWEGLGATLIFGLGCSTILTLLLIPIIFNLLFAKDAARDAQIRELQNQAI